ncbi:hypothetical protein ACI2OX_04610 [Bacillus sp. N9]
MTMKASPIVAMDVKELPNVMDTIPVTRATSGTNNDGLMSDNP